MPDFHPLLILELFLFSGGALAWGAWEFWRTDKLLKKTRAEEQAAKENEKAV